MVWPRFLPCNSALGQDLQVPSLQAPPRPLVTGPHTWLTHALLDAFQLGGGQGSGLLLKAAVSLLSQLPEARSRPCAGPSLHADWYFLKAVTETEIVADSVLPALWSRLEKGEMLSVDREEW